MLCCSPDCEENSSREFIYEGKAYPYCEPHYKLTKALVELTQVVVSLKQETGAIPSFETVYALMRSNDHVN
jgi:hypothetical protein